MSFIGQENKILREFYPLIKAYDSQYIKVSEIHELYFEQSGNPDGRPVLFLHGGPGMGLSTAARQYFNPSKYRIIQFDQRGAGKSRPHACLEENTTWDLVADIERIREYLGIGRWHVFGGSWGSTLAIAYAITHTEHVSAMGLRGVFLCREKEIQWMYQKGANYAYPEQWEKYIAPIPEIARDNFVSAFYEQLTSPDSTIRLSAARAWTEWELTMMNMLPPEKKTKPATDALLLAVARIECHYFHNNIFIDDDAFLLDGVQRLRHIPAVIVQGRHDMVCPAVTAWELHKAWPEADFKIIPDACHGFDEPGIVDVMVRAADRFYELEL